MKNFKWCWFIAVCLFCFVLGAEEPNTSSTVQETAIKISSWLTEAILSCIALVVALFTNWLRVKAGNNEARLNAIEALKVGVNHAWDTVGREWKNDSADGKLTNDEKERLRKLASEKAVEIAKGPAKDLLLDWGGEFIRMKIKEIVDSRKSHSISSAVELVEIKPEK